MADQQHKLPQLDRVLRLATIWAFWPALALSIAASVVTRNPHLGLMMIPMAGSLLLALFVLSGKKLPRNDIFRWSVPMADAALAASLIGGLVPFWILASSGAYTYRHMAMLSTYATVPMISNLAIHLFFALRVLNPATVFAGMFAASTCPHCQHSLRASDFTLPSEAGSHHSSPKISYGAVPIHDAENDAPETPRQSMIQVRQPKEDSDDESACLV